MKEPSVIEQKAYRDTWGKGLDSYLKWFYETVVLLRELLADDGSLYVHLDHHVSHYAKAVLDEVLGEDNFINEIIWRRTNNPKGSQHERQKFGQSTDTIFLYSKSAKFTLSINSVKRDLSESEIATKYNKADEYGPFYPGPVLRSKSMGVRPNLVYEYKGFKPGEAGWRMTKARLQELDAAGNLGWSSSGSPFRKLRSGETEAEPIFNLWDDIFRIYGTSAEGLSYPTQKPEALLERIIKASSNPGDLVLDCFCGSGTTAAVAEKLGRRWITCDLGRFAIHTARKRFLAIDNVRPFVVQNLGKYERQQWQQAEFGEEGSPPAPILGSNTEGLAASPPPKSGSPLKSGTPELGRGGYAERERAYREFILSLYSAKPIHGYLWLHGVKQGHMVHVGGVDAPVSVGDVAQAVAEFKRSRGTGADAPTQNRIDILGWDFAFELNEVSKQQAAAAGVEVKFVRIPREVLEKKAVEQGDIKFFELAALSVGVQTSGKGVTLTLKDFVIPLDDVPQEIQAAITHWEQWIDYWAVDWDNKGDTFHNQWQSYRTRKDKTIQKTIASPPGTYPQPGEYKIVVKVIDILGNDTTKTLKVQVK